MKSNVISCFAATAEKLDMFGVQPQLFFGKKDKYKSKTGFVLSLIVIFTIFVGFMFFGIELFQRVYPRVIKTELYTPNPPSFNLTQDKFSFFFGLQDKSFEYYIDPAIVTVNVIFSNITTVDKKTTTQNINLETEECNLEKHFPNRKSIYTMDLSNFICIKPEYYNFLQLSGTQGQDVFKYITIDLKKCKDGSGVTCKSTEEINKKLNGGYFRINQIDSLFQPRDFEVPINYTARDYFTTISDKYYKELTFYYKNINYTTDDGYIFENDSANRYLRYDYKNEFFDFRDTDEGEFFKCLMRLSTIEDVYHRSYMKLQEVIAEVGGLIQFIFMFIEFAYIGIVMQQKYFYNLIENMFKLVYDKEVKLDNKYVSFYHTVDISRSDKKVARQYNPSAGRASRPTNGRNNPIIPNPNCNANLNGTNTNTNNNTNNNTNAHLGNNSNTNNVNLSFTNKNVVGNLNSNLSNLNNNSNNNSDLSPQRLPYRNANGSNNNLNSNSNTNAINLNYNPNQQLANKSAFSTLRTNNGNEPAIGKAMHNPPESSPHLIRLHLRHNERLLTNLIASFKKEKRLPGYIKYKFILCKCFQDKHSGSKFSTYSRLLDYLKCQLDVKNLLVTYQELEIMKDIMMMEDQKMLFEFVAFKDITRKRAMNKEYDEGRIIDAYDTVLCSEDNFYDKSLRKLFINKLGL